jgi:hypothetical protein
MIKVNMDHDIKCYVCEKKNSYEDMMVNPCSCKSIHVKECMDQFTSDEIQFGKNSQCNRCSQKYKYKTEEYIDYNNGYKMLYRLVYMVLLCTVTIYLVYNGYFGREDNDKIIIYKYYVLNGSVYDHKITQSVYHDNIMAIIGFLLYVVSIIMYCATIYCFDSYFYTTLFTSIVHIINCCSHYIYLYIVTRYSLELYDVIGDKISVTTISYGYTVILMTCSIIGLIGLGSYLCYIDNKYHFIKKRIVVEYV